MSGERAIVLDGRSGVMGFGGSGGRAAALLFALAAAAALALSFG